MSDSLPRSSVQARLALSAAIVFAGGLLAGCPPVRKPTATMPATTQSVGLAPVLGTEPVAEGIYVSLGAYTPLTGDALSRAMSDRAAIRKTVESSIAAATTAPATQSAPKTADGEAPPLAVKYYLQGREKFLDGANTEAMEFLEKALQLDPNAFTVLRLMGRVCFASSQLARGALYLQRAQQADPNDVEVDYLLGRYWLERKDADRAVYYLLRADDSPERSVSSAQAPLVSFYLARAMQASGYHRAAAAEYEQFLSTVALPVPGYRYDRELNYLIEEQWTTHLLVAENDVLLGDYAAVLPHYRAAAQAQPDDPFVMSRLVNAEVHSGHMDDARAAALSLVSQTKGSDPSLQLLAWVYRAGGREDQLIPDLRNRMGALGDEVTATLTLAATLDYVGRKQEAFDTLRTYLQAHPDSLDVLGRLLKRVDSAATFAQALAAAAEMIDAKPASADAVVKLFAPLVTTSSAAVYLAQRGEGNPSATLHETAGTLYLTALTQQAQNAPLAAIDASFSAALHAQPRVEAAREAYVTWLLAQEKFQQASDLIQEAIHDSQAGPKAWQLLVQSEAAQQRFSNALRLAQEATKKYPDNPDVRFQLATVYRLRQQDQQADAELNHLIDDFPKFEPAYAALINSLILRSQDLGPNADLGTVVSVLGRLLREVPSSKFGQVTMATIYARAGRLQEAEGMLRRLLANNPDDAAILNPLAQIRQALGHPDEAITLLENSLKSHPQVDVARILLAMDTEQGKTADALALAARLTKENPDNDGFVILQASVLVSEKKRDEAITLLRAAQSHLPRSQQIALELARLQELADHPTEAVKTLQAFMARNGETPERLYLLSHFYSAAENDNDAVATLQRVLALMPDHTGANNDLGYFWVDAGIHLDQAEPMIRKAIDNEPNNSAFLDSLGWLYYKQGRYTDAISSLEKSIAEPGGMESDVLQHLGDALYRAGRKPEALERWTQAQSLLEMEGGQPSKAQQKLKAYLDQATTAARAGETPTLTPTAADKKPQAADRTTNPASAEFSPQSHRVTEARRTHRETKNIEEPPTNESKNMTTDH